MARHIEIIKLIAEIAVMLNAGEQMQEQLGGAEDDESADGKVGERSVVDL
jgi:hypothetical protein